MLTRRLPPFSEIPLSSLSSCKTLASRAFKWYVTRSFKVNNGHSTLTCPRQDDVYSLDPATLEALQPIHALIFLFKWVGQTPQSEALAQGNDDLRGEEITDPEDYLGVYFANQVMLRYENRVV